MEPTAPTAPSTESALSALADVAANLFITLPQSPHGKPFISQEEAGSPAKLLRALRKRLNLTQREFGVLLSPGGASPISPSVVCQLESALQNVPPPLITRAVSAAAAVQRFGDFVATRPGSTFLDAAAVLKSLGPGCIDQLEPYTNEAPNLPVDDPAMVGEFLAIVTKRKPSSGGSRPGARGPYRKLSKLNNFSIGDDQSSTAPATNASAIMIDATAGTGCPRNTFTPVEAMEAMSDNTVTPQSSLSSTPCSTPSSSRGSSRPRSPNGSDISLPNDVDASDASSLNILMALRRLQEENELLERENKRLRMMVGTLPDANLVTDANQAEVPRGDITMHC